MEQVHHDTPRFTRRQWLKTAAALVAGGIAVRPAAASANASGSITPEAASTEKADGTTRRKVSRISELRTVACTQCDACMPCGYGIDIPGNFRFYNAMLEEGSVPDIATGDPESGEFARKAKRFLRKYDRAVPDAHQSQRCIKCFHCVSECREGIFIVNELGALTALTDYLRDWECTH